MIKYPLTFHSASKSGSGITTLWQGAGEGLPSIAMAIPPEFEGPGGGYSPEDLYALALQNCFVATFKVFAEKSRLAFTSISVDAELTVDRNENGRPWMAKVALKIKVDGAAKESAMRILDKTAQNCLILNSVRTEKTFSFEVTP